MRFYLSQKPRQEIDFQDSVMVGEGETSDIDAAKAKLDKILAET